MTSFNAILEEPLVGLLEGLVKDIVLLVAYVMSSWIDQRVVLKWLESIDYDIEYLDILDAIEELAELSSNNIKELFSRAVVDGIGPGLEVIEVPFLQNLNSLLVNLRTLLEYPPDLSDVEYLVIEDVLLLKEVQDVVGGSVVQDVL